MTLENVPASNPAGQALIRILRLALPDDAARQRALQGALRSANRSALPSDGDDLLQLVRAHLAPQLSEDVAPNLVFALIDDLQAEIEHQAAGRDPTSSARLRAATCAPPPGLNGEEAPPRTLPLASNGHAAHDVPFPKLRASVSNLRRATASALRAVVPSLALRAGSEPPSVVVVDSDRMVRASLARALVGARFDVSALENPSEMGDWIRDRQGIAVAVMDEDTVQDAGLGPLLEAHPNLCLVVRTDSSPKLLEGALSGVASDRLRVVTRVSGAGEILDCVRSFCSRP